MLHHPLSYARDKASQNKGKCQKKHTYNKVLPIIYNASTFAGNLSNTIIRIENSNISVIKQYDKLLSKPCRWHGYSLDLC